MFPTENQWSDAIRTTNASKNLAGDQGKCATLPTSKVATIWGANRKATAMFLAIRLSGRNRRRSSTLWGPSSSDRKVPSKAGHFGRRMTLGPGPEGGAYRTSRTPSGIARSVQGSAVPSRPVRRARRAAGVTAADTGGVIPDAALSIMGCCRSMRCAIAAQAKVAEAARIGIASTYGREKSAARVPRWPAERAALIQTRAQKKPLNQVPCAGGIQFAAWNRIGKQLAQVERGPESRRDDRRELPINGHEQQQPC
jgi:hypothetical protein